MYGKGHPFYGFLYRYRRSYAWGLVTLAWVDLINVLLPLLIRESLDAIPNGLFSRVLVSAAAILFLMSLQSVGRYHWRLFLMGASNRVSSDLRRDLYAHLQRLPLSYYHRVRTGDLMSKATSDVESVRMAVGPGVLVAADAVLMFVLIVPVMAYLSIRLTLLAFALYPLVPILTRVLGGKIENYFDNLQNKLSTLSAFAQESFGAVRLIKSLTLEGRSANRFGDLSLEYTAEGKRLAKVEALFSPSLGLITNVGTFLILLLGGIDVTMGAITLGTFVAFQRFVVQLSWPMEAIGWAVTLNREGLAAMGRLQSVFDQPVVTSKETAGNESGAQLDIRGLRFAYGSEFNLELPDLVVTAGKRIGIVGPVGSGKTTLFNCLLRLYEPPPGTIFLGGVDITTIGHRRLRNRVVSVEQQVFLFSESIAANVGMGSHGVNAERITHALSVAGILREVESFSDGAQSVLGERGVNLSGGQKSRIALARALVRVPSVLILDDCFSHVDVQVESRIVDSLLSEFPSLTILVASHRLSIMPLLDEIWVLENGRLHARGTHEELLGRSALYQALWYRAKADLLSHEEESFA